MLPGVTCASCVLYAPNTRKPGSGQCRARAPELEITDMGPRTVFPLMPAHGWCGNHSTLEQEAAAT